MRPFHMSLEKILTHKCRLWMGTKMTRIGSNASMAKFMALALVLPQKA